MRDVDTDRIEECLGASGKAMSVDAPYADNEENCYLDNMTGEVFASTDSKVDQESLGTDLATTLSVLNERELTVIHYLFGLNEKHEMSLEEVANMMGLTRERVRQIRRMPYAISAKARIRISSENIWHAKVGLLAHE